jgi:hypothetical protein
MRCIRDPFATRGSFMREVSSRRPLTSLAVEAEAGMILGGAGPAHHRRNYVNSGETLDKRRARLILTRFGPDVRRVGQALADRLRAERPGRKGEGAISGLQSRLHAYGHPCSPDLNGIALGHVANEPSGRGITAIVIRLEWAWTGVRASVPGWSGR